VPAITALSIFPVVVMSWNFGLFGSILAIVFATIVNAIYLIFVFDFSFASAFLSLVVLGRDTELILVFPVVHLLSEQNRRLKREIDEREKLEKERRDMIDFHPIF
jgi:glucose-6-phosphate-specific signal transduction histidine kinase